MSKGNKRHPQPREAVALQYQSSLQEAPIILAKGKGVVAENILEKGKKNDIPIQQDKTLVELLGQLDINEAIPEELYNAVAEVFAFIYQLDRKQAKN